MIHSFRLIKGDPKTALAQPNTIVLIRSMALKYFGDEDPIGKNLNADKRRDYLVTGVVENGPKMGAGPKPMILTLGGGTMIGGRSRETVDGRRKSQFSSL